MPSAGAARAVLAGRRAAPPLPSRRGSSGRALVELEDVAVRVERVEALAAGVRATGHLHRTVRTEGDAARQQILVELFDPGDEDAEVPRPVVRGRRAPGRAVATVVLDQLDVDVAL